MQDLRTAPPCRSRSSQILLATGLHSRCRVSDKQARVQALSEWLLEFSVLWAVFPLLDQLIENRPIQSGLTITAFGICFVALTGGILLRKGDAT